MSDEHKDVVVPLAAPAEPTKIAEPPKPAPEATHAPARALSGTDEVHAMAAKEIKWHQEQNKAEREKAAKEAQAARDKVNQKNS